MSSAPLTLDFSTLLWTACNWKPCFAAFWIHVLPAAPATSKEETTRVRLHLVPPSFGKNFGLRVLAEAWMSTLWTD